MATVWIDTIFNIDVVAGVQRVDSLMQAASATTLRLDRLTLLRTIVRFDLAAAVHDSGEGSAGMALGLAVVSQEAFNAAVVPDPGQGTDHPTRGWIWRGNFRVFAFAADQPAVHVRVVERDLRSRRKLDNGEMVLISDNSTLEGAAVPVKIFGLVRCLYLDA